MTKYHTEDLARLNELRRRKRILFIGPPAVGKSTQGRLLCNKFGVEYISWGKLSRFLKRSMHPLGAILRHADAKATPHPAETVARYLAENAILPAELSGRNWILDGFPRTVNELEALQQVLESNGSTLTDIVVFDLPDSICGQRSEGRVRCPECDATYTDEDDLLVCPRDGAGLTIRADDASIQERLMYYREDSPQLISFLKVQPQVRMHNVSAAGESAELHCEIVAKLHFEQPGGGEWVGSWCSHVSEARLPTEFGEFQVHAFEHKLSQDIHLALIAGNPTGSYRVPVRIHSSCITGDIFRSKKCECGLQLEAAARYIQSKGIGIVVYLFQEGRGIGILNKLKAYRLQEIGADTVEANRALFLPDDARSYEMAIDILKYSGAASIELLTNNPAKVEPLLRGGINVLGAIPLRCELNEFSETYVQTKNRRMGHIA